MPSWEPANRNSIEFFMERMAGHDKVDGVPIREAAGLFRINRNGMRSLRMVYVGTYQFGLADVDLLPTLLTRGDYVVIQEHCSFSPDAGEVLRQRGIGIGRIRDFMGALNREWVVGA